MCDVGLFLFVVMLLMLDMVFAMLGRMFVIWLIWDRMLLRWVIFAMMCVMLDRMFVIVVIVMILIFVCNVG